MPGDKQRSPFGAPRRARGGQRAVDEGDRIARGDQKSGARSPTIRPNPTSQHLSSRGANARLTNCLLLSRSRPQLPILPPTPALNSTPKTGAQPQPPPPLLLFCSSSN